MSIESKYILNIINNLNKHNIKLNTHKITDNKYFMNIYNNIKNILKIIKINNIKINEVNKQIIENNNFTSNEIKNTINNKLKYSYHINYDNNNIYYITSKKILKIPKIIKNMFTIIILLKKLFNRNNFEQNIQYFETNLKKKFPKNKTKVLGINECNSGLTNISTNKNGNIILFRKEEILKVLIHELIHSNLIDYNIIFSKKNISMNEIICVKYNILLNEAYTETFATIINIFYLHLINNLDKKILNEMFNNELKYSTYISSKIIHYYKIDNIEFIIKNNNYCKNIFPQNTNVFSYYIIKNILLYNHYNLSKILLNNKIEYKISDDNTINEIIKLIKNNILNFNKRLINFKNIKDNNNSLRMCLY